MVARRCETAVGRPNLAFYRQRCGEYPRTPWCGLPFGLATRVCSSRALASREVPAEDILGFYGGAVAEGGIEGGLARIRARILS